MLVRWTPFADMDRLQRELSGLFDSSNGHTEHAWKPAVDVNEDAQRIELTFDLPGVKQEDLDIQVDKNVLTLRGARKIERKQDKEYAQRYERVTGSFSRSFTLPQTVDVEKIAAQLKDGVLTLTLPKKAEAQPKQIKVSVSS